MTQTPLPSTPIVDHEGAVRARYAAAAVRAEPALCCPTSYDASLLRMLPEEIKAKDYGCGDPSQFVHTGETVVDLGSGAGKICYILSQKVGPTGRVIGVDVNDDMLALARKYQRQMAERLGHDNVRFVKARIQDLGLDLEALERWLAAYPVQDLAGLHALELQRESLRRRSPAIADGIADVVVSNCVLNLVRPADKEALFAEMFRVLARGGRAVISDIVCDEEPGQAIRNDPHLWSGCIAGAFVEDEFLRAFERAGFYGIEILERAAEPWQVVHGIEFRSVTVRAFRGKDGPCLERNQAVIYQGPWRQVVDDDGHTYRRGERSAVCDKTYRILTSEIGPYAWQFAPVPPSLEVPIDTAGAFDCEVGAIRAPRASKGLDYRETRLRGAEPSCGDGSCC